MDTESTTTTTTTTPPEPTQTTEPSPSNTVLTQQGDGSPTPATPPASSASADPPAADGSTAPPTSEPSWVDSLPEDLKKNERLAGFKSVEELARAHADAKLAATVPEADKYVLPEKFPVKDIGKWANHVGLTQEQLNHIIKLNDTMSVAAEENTAKAYETGLNVLFESWGEQKGQKLSLAKRALDFFDDSKEMRMLLNQTKAGNHPIVVNFFAKMGERLMKEDGFIPNGGLNTSSQTKSDADIIFDGK